MAENVVLGTFGTLQNSSIIATLNANNVLLETALADCLSLSGTTPNSMLSILDMNNYNIINLPAPSTVNSPVRVIDLEQAIIGTTSSIFGLLAGNNTWSGINNFGSLPPTAFITNKPLVTFYGTSSNQSVILADCDLVVSGNNTLTSVDNAAFRAVAQVNIPGYTASTGNTYLRAGEFHVLLGTGTVYGSGNEKTLEVGMHTQVAGNGTTAICGIQLFCDHSGWLSSGLRADSALYVYGVDGWNYGYLYKDTDNTTTLASIDQHGNAFFKGSITATSGSTGSIFGGSAANSLLVLTSTSSNSPSGDYITLRGSSIYFQSSPMGVTQFLDYNGTSAGVWTFSKPVLVAGATSKTALAVQGVGNAAIYIDYTGSGTSFYDAGTHVIRSASGSSTLFDYNSSNSASWTSSADLFISPGTLGNGASALTITATQPSSPVAGQNAISFQITSAGSASQGNRALLVSYLSGYTGSSPVISGQFLNQVSGTGATLVASSGTNQVVGNTGIQGNSSSTTTGINVGTAGFGSGGSVSVGLFGTAQVAKNSSTNIGVSGTAINTGSSPVQIGGWFSLNQTSVPSVSAALIADNGSQSNPIILGQVNGTTSFQVGSTGIVSHSANTAVGTGSSPLTVVLYSTTASLGIYAGTGAPTFSSVAGSIYIRTDGAAATALYLCTGTTTWVAVT
jgi:hypothetical protein